MMKKVKYIFYLCIVGFVSSIVCAQFTGRNLMILDAKDVAELNVDEQRAGLKTFLTISGLAFHSALAVSKIETTITTEHILLINVYLTRARPGLSGSFSYRVELPEGIERVEFGGDRRVIWVSH